MLGPGRGAGLLYLEWLFVETSASVLIENLLLAQNAVQHSACLLDVVVLHQHRACDKLGVSHFHLPLERPELKKRLHKQ